MQLDSMGVDCLKKQLTAIVVIQLIQALNTTKTADCIRRFEV